jgi:hypothetical protein
MIDSFTLISDLRHASGIRLFPVLYRGLFSRPIRILSRGLFPVPIRILSRGLFRILFQNLLQE